MTKCERITKCSVFSHGAVRCVATPGNANRQYNSINHTELNLVGKCENDMSAMASTQLLSLNLASYIHPSV